MADDRRLLLLFDGNALVHRAFHALPPLTVPGTGEMINAVRGFASTLLKLWADVRPSHWCIAFDLPEPTFRHKQFADYKKHRPPTPAELVNQIGRVHQLAEAFRIPVFEIAGYEADDILGALSHQAKQQGMDTIIVTGDNDILQLVSKGVKVMTPRRSFGDTILYDEQQVRQKYSLGPDQLIDLKALTGDSSDNIPGIRGVGEKTAVKLLQQFNTVEGIYEHIDLVEPERIRELLRQGQGRVMENKGLVTIVTDMPVTLDLNSCKVSDYERQRVVDLFRELGFVKLLSSLPGDGEDVKTESGNGIAADVKYQVVATQETLDSLVQQLKTAGEFAIDTETTSTNAMTAELVGISLASTPGEAFYIPVGHRTLSEITQLPVEQVLKKLRPLIEDGAVRKIAQNGKYDMIVLSEHGLPFDNLQFDTMIAAHLAGEKTLGLKALAFNKLGIEMTPISDLIGKGAKQVPMSMVDIEKAADYACADADMTLRIKQLMEPELVSEELRDLFRDVEMPLVPVLVDMERNGVALDTGQLKNMSESIGGDMKRLEQEIFGHVGHVFNINSSQQLSDVLFRELQLSKPRKTKSGYSTDAAVLETLRGTHPVIDCILEYRQLAKLKSTYTDSLLALINPRTGRVHTSYNQAGTSTGRLSSSEPNLQNIPVRGEMGRKIRRAIIAQPGWSLISADYSQIDLRALAHLSGDRELIDTFLRDEDVHTATAARIFNISADSVTPEMRRAAKTVNFGVIYGMSEYGLEQATDFNREEAARFITSYFEKYPSVRNYLESTKTQARENGYVQTILGRRRYIPEINSTNRQVREAAERMAINMPVQGTSADIIKLAMLNIHHEMKQDNVKSKMILQVHDELVFEVPPEEMNAMKSLAIDLMQQAMKLSVPLKIDVKTGTNWDEMSLFTTVFKLFKCK
ncbi:MAG: DNA polymerase I [Dehalococcoidia bacterium]